MIFYESGNCLPDVSDAEYDSVCEENGGSINFTYTIRTQLRDDVNFQVVCNFPQVILSKMVIHVLGNKI